MESSEINTLFSSFVDTLPQSEWEREVKARVYKLHNSTWRVEAKASDPYQLLPFCVASTPKGNADKYMLVMYGKAIRLDEDTLEPIEVDGVAKASRVRVAVMFSNGMEYMAFHEQGEQIGEAESKSGMFAEAVEAMRLLQEIFNDD